jgi:branched-chain amino acid transport system substrate-binding protein
MNHNPTGRVGRKPVRTGGSRRIFPAIVLSAAILLFACQKRGDEIAIGEFGSLTGGTATFGISSDEGIRLAMDEVNQKGGVLGKKIRLVVEDDQSKPEEAKTAVLKLLKQDRVVALLGEVASSRSLAAAPEAQRAKVPMISPASTNPKVTEVGDFIFRVCFIDPFQGSAMAHFARQTLKIDRAAILTDIRNEYSVGLARFFKDTFAKEGGEVVQEESYSEGDIEFRAQLTSIKATKPQAIFIPGYYTEVGLIARQARDLGLDQILLGGDGWDSPQTTSIGGEAVSGAYFSTHYAADDPDPKVQGFIAKYRKSYNKTPDAMAVLGYDAAAILVDAIGRAGSIEGAQIRDALAQTRDFPGVSGAITIDENRNATKSLVVLKISGGQFRFFERVKP